MGDGLTHGNPRRTRFLRSGQISTTHSAFEGVGHVVFANSASSDGVPESMLLWIVKSEL